ncbi:unnamed protein product [Nippostrongylus brasiliensis]|uniref:GPI transamidase component PIG-S (inferred by orthology to a human protein) n=1 Tax=Nippostrongylus brasiliensis TaxID=27835 RepID=A0A0N4YC61_NIPBR|nr:unnamed protein product [Nippostrongylus brasiliensis]
MNGLIDKLKALRGLAEKKPCEENLPKNMTEVINRLPESYHKHMQAELPYRRAAALVFIAIVLGLGTPLWYHTTRTYRAPFSIFPESQSVSLSITVRLVTTSSLLEKDMDAIAQSLLPKLVEGEVKPPLKIQWKVVNDGVMIDIPHLNAIVKRDMRERLQPWQIAALSPSHQKRLVWDSAPLSMHYIVQVMHVYDNASPDVAQSKELLKVIEVFAKRLRNVTNIQISSEHLWDFEVSNFLEIDVQGRSTLPQAGMERLLSEIDSQLQSVESPSPVLKLVIIESEVPIMIMDSFGDDSHGSVVASWGAIIPRVVSGEKEGGVRTGERVLGALRVLLGVDSELPTTWKRAPVPLSGWEVERMRLRAVLDNAMRAISAVSALKALTEKITNVEIGDDVAASANEAVKLLHIHIQITSGRFLADEALSHPSLLSMLYFPTDQTMAVYLPIMLPTLIPLFGSIVALFKWVFGWT